MTMSELVKVEHLNAPVVKMFLKQFGVSPEVISDNISMVETLISSVQASGKYETVADILADEELVQSVLTMFQGEQNSEDSTEEGFYLHGDTIIRCEKCGHVHILKEMENKNA